MLKPLPRGLNLIENEYSLTIERKWFNYSYIFILVFCAFWDGILISFYAGMLTSFTKDIEGNIDLSMLPVLFFPIIHVAVGVGLTYYGLSGLLNKTIINSSNGLLTVKHTPLPWFGNHKIDTANIRQLYCAEKTRHTKSGHYHVYDLNVILNDDKQIHLVKNLPELDQAVFLEENIEKYLNIKDEQVMGEIKKT